MALLTVSKTRFVGWQWARSPCNSLWTHLASRKWSSLIRDVKNSCLLRCSPANTLCQAQERMNTVQTQYKVWLAGSTKKIWVSPSSGNSCKFCWCFCLQVHLKTICNYLDASIMSASCWYRREVCCLTRFGTATQFLKKKFKFRKPFCIVSKHSNIAFKRYQIKYPIGSNPTIIRKFLPILRHHAWSHIIQIWELQTSIPALLKIF